MKRLDRTIHETWRGVAFAAALLMALGLALGSCSKRIATVDPSYTQPEGRFTPDAQLVLWYEATVRESVFFDKNVDILGPDRDPYCPQRLRIDTGDSLKRVVSYSVETPGTIHTMIFDKTAASAFRPMRRQANGGYREILDFPLNPTRKWLDSAWEFYQMVDPSPSGFTPPTYMARGIVAGLESADSPLTNEAMLQTSSTSAQVADIEYTGKCLPCDSLFTLSWRPVAGAARYWIHVYQMASGSNDDDRLRSSLAAPINVVKPRDILVALAQPSVTSYRMGSPPPPGLEILIQRGTSYGQLFQVRVSAVDANGQLIALTSGDPNLIVTGSEYSLYRSGSKLVQAKRPSGTPPFCQP